MAPQAMTEYERRRLENVRRNEEMVATLKRRADELSASIKGAKVKPHRPHPKSPPQGPVVLRRSLRARGIPPVPSRHPSEPPAPIYPAKKKGPLRMEEAFVGDSPLDRHLVSAILGMADNGPLHSRKKGSTGGGGSWDPAGELTLAPENVERFLPGRILSVCFFPFEGRTVVAAGDALGHLGFWDADFAGSEGDGTYLYAPHLASVSGISIHPFSLSKIFTCSYDGFIRLMDVEEETFNMLYSTDEFIYSISQPPNDAKSLYFGEGLGELKVWDERAGKLSNTWVLHDQRINTIDFNTVNSNLVATSSTDGVACIWDLRKIEAKKPERVKTVRHTRAIHSAYFSPNGSSLATTSVDNRVGILSGPDFNSVTMIRHYNQTRRWSSWFRAIWGWDDTCLFLGNMKRGVDVISTVGKTTSSLTSPLLTAIPCRFAVHPYKIGLLAGATGGGQVYMWRRS